MMEKPDLSQTYKFTPLDIATYIKWSQLSGERELEVIKNIWDLRKLLLAGSCGTRFETFKRRVYDELHQLWLRDFVNEHCPLSRALDLEKQAAQFLPKNEASLELYLKLMAIHLRLTARLPLISVNWHAILSNNGIKKPSKRLWSRLQIAMDALMLKQAGNKRNPYTFEDFMNNATFELSLKG